MDKVLQYGQQRREIFLSILRKYSEGSLSRKQVRVAILVLLTLLFILRALFFAGSSGSIEHDSGWLLGVAKNLAERGIYASYTNTITANTVGANPSIHGRYSVQDAQGYEYFPAAVSVGPGYIVPEAILLKLFGSSWWTYRLWPLLAYTGLLLVAFAIVLSLGNIPSLLIFATWLWALPQFTLQFAYEAYSEDIALFYFLSAFLLLYLANTRFSQLRQQISLFFLCRHSLCTCISHKSYFAFTDL